MLVSYWSDLSSGGSLFDFAFHLHSLQPFLSPNSTGTAALNKTLFNKKVDLAAAAIQDPRLISHYRKVLHSAKELLHVERISPIRPHPDKALADQGRKSSETWGPALKDGVQKQELTVIPYELQLDYDYWNFRDIMSSILPEELHDDIPGGFNVAGHVVDNVGSESEFRTFQYEVLAGPDDLNVQVAESGCTFEFDYSKVYWNSKLETEHRRLINIFQPGEVVCDVMAGIGPFAVPAGKKRVFVWANDKNPESFACLEAAIKKNKVSPFVRPFCADGLAFIHQAADSVLAASQNGEHATITHKEKPEHLPIPPTITHFVMNLPASAIEFLGSFRGVYAGQEQLFAPHTKTRLPMVHVHCFSVKADDETPRVDICERITRELGCEVKWDGRFNAEIGRVRREEEGLWRCIILPKEVAFAARK
ncbi:tRNA(m(1)G37)methyltransferase [Collariella sp. IMI 366227]|nr:tRNA(m(1)G37)methyltransferase [Collariella sp. IMI 366227]